jgi:phytoene synthase
LVDLLTRLSSSLTRLSSSRTRGPSLISSSRTRESTKTAQLDWIPAFAGMTASPGSDFYYVLRQIALPKRQACQAFWAWSAELNHIAEHYREADIADKKLAWWQSEIDLLFKGTPQHPLTRAFLPYRDLLRPQALNALIEANRLSLKTHIFETRSELFQHYQHLGGIRFAELSRLLGEIVAEPLLHEAGIMAEIFRHLIDFRFFLQKQHLYFALEDFQAHDIAPQPVIQGKALDTLAPLFDTYFNFACATLTPTFLKSLPRPLRLILRLQKKQLLLIQKDAWQFYRHQVELSPLQKLFFTHFLCR